MSDHARQYMSEVQEIAGAIDWQAIERMADRLVQLREREGRLFLLGVGGSAGNCGHATNDFRKLCGIEAYAPTDNVSELTARTNDEGWDTVFAAWLKTSRARAGDAIFVLSVGGGDAEKNISANLVKAIDYAKERGVEVLGIVGRPTVHPERVTPQSEAFQAVVWHCLVCHPKLQQQGAKWETAVRQPG
jgi:D-sedoheptulose 7-phosphate isomerase